MKYSVVGLFLMVLVCANPVSAGEKTTKILLIGKDRDHPYATHEYMAECALLAKCLQQTPGVETIVSNGWPKNADTLKDVKAIVLYTRNGGNVLFDPFNAQQAETLLKNGVGLTAIHWSTGAEGTPGPNWLDALGGWFSTKFCKLNTTTTKLKQAEPAHPICRGWKEFDLRDEFYLQLKFKDTIKPILKVELENKEHTVAWTYDRPDAKNGRSFGCVLGHFHANFGEKPFRQALVNGILWTAHREVPEAGAPIAITPKDLELPPQAPAKEKKQGVDDPTKKNDRLRRPGFLFLELDCRDLQAHIDFFKTVTGFELNRKDGNFVILRSEHGEILLNGIGGKAKEKPVRYQGPRVEIGIVVADLDQSFAAAKKCTGWTIAAGIARQSWGVRDYRVYSPEGYYLRITEGPR